VVLKSVQAKALTAGVLLVPAQSKRHARELGRIMRAADRTEILASGGMEPHKAVRASINHQYGAEAWAGYVGGDLLAVFGVVDFPTGWAAPWLMSSIYVDRYPLTFWRASRVIVADIRERYPKMVQMVYAGYGNALRWAGRLGFKVEEPVRFGKENTLFCRISMETPKLILEVR